MSNKPPIKCPLCGSEEVAKPRLSSLAFVISIFLLSFPLPVKSKTCHCFDCGCDFKKKKQPENLD